jgi:2,3-bisphosphoglycerate-dependent phosphoglycerate mutase
VTSEQPGLLILLRHGQSTWNAARRFTGWADPPLTDRGRQEATNAGRALLGAGLCPDVVVTSLLARAEQTVSGVLGAVATSAPILTTWRLNERHYGALQGMTHAAARDKYGAVSVERWRRSWSGRPPALDPADERHPLHDARYADVPPAALPAAESLADCLARQLPFLTTEVTRAVTDGGRVLLVGHGNSLRALVAHFDNTPPEQVPRLLIPTGVPLLYVHESRWRRVPQSFGLQGTTTGP